MLRLSQNDINLNGMDTINRTSQLLERNAIETQLEKISNKNVFLGFDAFIDVVATPIKKGSGVKPLEFFETTKDLGTFINQLDEKNCSIEVLDQKPRIGGNMVITAKAISSFGLKTHCFGTFGYPVTHSIFSEMALDSNLISIGNPGESLVLEFKNGKIIFGMNRDVNNLDWSTVKERAGISKIQKYVDLSDLIFLLNWSELPGSTGIFKGMSDEVLSKTIGNKILFIDFSDCSRREKSEIIQILSIISELPDNIKVVLSLNKNEEEVICTAIGLDSKCTLERGRKLVQELDLKAIFFHSRDLNAVVTADDCATFSPEIEPNPVLYVGAGDNFNAGAAIALLMELPLSETLDLATKTAAYYLKNGKNYNYKSCGVMSSVDGCTLRTE
ncbi:MAG: PfkB family carbohydrate kinase [Dehalococcoidia bacterium]